MKIYFNGLNCMLFSPILYFFTKFITKNLPELIKNGDFYYHFIFNDEVGNLIIGIFISISTFYLIKYNEIKRDLSIMTPISECQISHILHLSSTEDQTYNHEDRLKEIILELMQIVKKGDEVSLKEYLKKYLDGALEIVMKSRYGEDILIDFTLNRNKSQNLIMRKNYNEQFNKKIIFYKYDFEKTYFMNRYTYNIPPNIQKNYYFEETEDSMQCIVDGKKWADSAEMKTLKQQKEIFLRENYHQFIKDEINLLIKLEKTKKNIFLLMLRQEIF